jgi:threonine dehydrogenase-like Zn-dependent dehydrogenase
LAGEPLDLLVETAGSLPAMDTATRLVRHGGRVVLLGIPGESKTLELPGNRLIDKDLQMTASLSYTSAVFTRMVRLVEHRVVDLAPIVTHRFRSQDFLSAFALMQRREGTVGKILLEHVPDSG